jgi:hypothetical protein
MRRASTLYSQTSHIGFWISPVNGLGALERLRRGLSDLRGRLGCGAGLIGPPGMDDEAEKHQCDQAELVKQEVRNHDDVSIHEGERRQFYHIRSLPNYPLPTGTGPFRRLLYHD